MAQFDWSFPYPSQRMPVLASNVIATSQPLAAQAGLDCLRTGGNAVDAAIAAAIALTVVEPTSNGIGSDAFAIVWDGQGLHGLNASGRTPRGLDCSRFDEMDRMPQLGWDAVTVPGAVSAWEALSERFGRLPFARLFDRAIEYARAGFLLSPQTAEAWSRAVDRYAAFEPFARTFLPDGRAPKPGERIALPEHAQTLERIAETRGEAFYRGDLAEKIVADANRHGCPWRAEDLAEHAPEWIDPLDQSFGGAHLHELPPNGQGIAALIAIGIMNQRRWRDHEPDSAESLHEQIEAMKIALALAHRTVADPSWMAVDARSLLDDEFLAEQAGRIDRQAAGDPGYVLPQYSSTVYLAAGDADGRMVSFIQSNFEGFGSGVVIPGTGIAMQNRGAGFTLERGHPNDIGPGKRPFHTIIPGFVTDAASGQPRMAFGVMGGPMQPQGHVQMMMRIFGWGQNPQAALDAPRWRVDGGRRVILEPGFGPDVAGRLAEIGHEVETVSERTVRHGGGQIVYRLSGGYLGASDLRRDGQAVGF